MPVTKTERVLAALYAALGESTEWLTGLALWERCRLMPGTTYPILLRLRHRGLVERRTETLQQGGIRAFYRLTPDGVRR